MEAIERRDEPPGAGAASWRVLEQPHRPREGQGHGFDSSRQRSGYQRAVARIADRTPAGPLASITKSLWLASLHAGQWQTLSTRYAAMRALALRDPDEIRRDAWLAGIEQQENAEGAALAKKQVDETEADINAQLDARERAKRDYNLRSPHF